MIRIKSGTCGTSQGYMTSADGELMLPAAEEKRLVSRGVADYVTKPIIGGASGSTMPASSPYPERMPQDTIKEETSAETAAGGKNGPSDGMSVAVLERMTKADLERMAQDMGVDISGAKNNRERAELIAAAETEDGGQSEMDDEDIVK